MVFSAGGAAFYQSGIERIRIPSTLKEIKFETFSNCKSLRHVEFSEGLERICACAFRSSAVESVVLPSSTRIIGGDAFSSCEHLCSIQLNEGLKMLGFGEYHNE